MVKTSEMDRPLEYVRNDTQRCFHCKDELFTVMEQFAQQNAFDSIAYGVNVDDQGDFRRVSGLPDSIMWLRRFSTLDLPRPRFANFLNAPDCAYGTNPLPPAGVYPGSSMAAP